MVSYILKSAICLALLLAFYHLILEKEKMHIFNRFYLIGSVVFSFLVPLYIIYVDAAPIILEITESAVLNYPTEINVATAIDNKPFNYSLLFIGLYSVISFILLLRFSKNLFHIIKKTRDNPTIKYKTATLVLVDDKILPHTFWDYIFINKVEYESKKIEQELFTHELSHVTQKHTLDVLILEIIQCLFWINPFFILLKKAVQLNHEFLADETVINKHKNTFQYQYLLLNKAAWKNDYYLASNLNYSLTKKRLKMMTTQSSPTKILLKKLAVIPLLTGFIFLFAERVEAQEVIYEQSQEVQNLKQEKQSNNTNDVNLEVIEEQIFTSQGDKVKTGFTELNGNKHYYVSIGSKTKYYNKDGKLADSNGKILSLTKANASEIIPENYITKTFSDGMVFCEFNNDKPNHKVFYYNNKLIKQERALEIINNDGPVDISTQYIDGKTVIKLTKEKKKIYKKSISNGSKQSISSDSQKEKEIKNIIEEISDTYAQTSYKQLYNAYEIKRNVNPHYVKSDFKRQEELDNLFSNLGSLYFRLAKEDKKKVKKPTHPHDPYLKLKKNNKVFYKLRKDITEEDKLLFPPPPPRQNASKKEIAKAQKAYEEWKRRTGNDGAPPPPKQNSFTSKLEKLTKKEKKDNSFLKHNLNSSSNNETYIFKSKDTVYRFSRLSKKQKLELEQDATYYMNGKEFKFSELNDIVKPQDIKSTTVTTNKDGTTSIYITTRKN